LGNFLYEDYLATGGDVIFLRRLKRKLVRFFREYAQGWGNDLDNAFGVV
jgi:hypothetical protein